MAHNLWRESLEQRQELETHLRAQESTLLIRRILSKAEPMAAQMQNDVRLSCTALGTNPQPTARWQHRQARRPGATQQTQKHGLGAIVCMVRRGDEIRAEALRRGRKFDTPRVTRARMVRA